MRLGRMALRLPAARWRGRPYTCNVKVTERCNLRCNFCGLWRIGDKEAELTTAEHRVLAQDLARLRMARVVVTGGEPLLRGDILDIVAGYARAGPSVTLLTNGRLLTRELIHDLRRAGLQDLGVSLDTLDEEAQDRRCGGRDVVRYALQALELGAEALPRGIVQMLITITPENIQEVPRLVEKARSLGVGVVVNPVNLPAPSEEERILSRPDPDEGFGRFDPVVVDRVYDQLRRQKRAGLPILVSDRFLEDSRWYLKTGDYAWDCHAGRLYFTIFSDGRLAPCSDLAALLSVRSPGWTAEFRSREWQERAKDAAQACPGCIFSCWREVSYLVHDTSTLLERVLRTVPRLGRRAP